MFRALSKKRPPEGPSITPCPDPGERLYVIGDVHGRVDLLDAMLDRIASDISRLAGDGRRPRIVLVGDVIDRGDHSREVLDQLIKVEALSGAGALTVLKGNHEAALLRLFDRPERGKDWLRFGGMQTLASYGVAVPGADPDGDGLRALAVGLHKAMGEHVDFLRRCPLSFRSGNVVCVHAGLDPDAPGAEEEGALLWGRSRFIEAGGVEGYFVVHGHYDAAEPVIGGARACVDTGAYYSGRLCAVRIDDAVQVIDVRG